MIRAETVQDNLGLHLQHPKSPQSRSSNQSLGPVESSAKGVAFSLGPSVYKNIIKSNIKAPVSCVKKKSQIHLGHCLIIPNFTSQVLSYTTAYENQDKSLQRPTLYSQEA